MDNPKSASQIEVDHCKTVQKLQKQLRKENSAYLFNHPEIRAIIRVLLHALINEKSDNVYKLATDLFSCANLPMLTVMINKQLKYIAEQGRKSRYAGFDQDVILNERDSTHSLISTSSISDSITNILNYAFILPSNIK